jgi:predicted cupin superfamily sugar epimerase
MSLTAKEVIELLGLKPLPREGGWYRETYRSTLQLPMSVLPAPHAACTAMFYLLTPDAFSAMHRLPTDEVFHFYLGDPVEMLLLGNAGGQRTVLGPDILHGQLVQHVVPAGLWQGSRLCEGGAFALLGTTMAPGFDFADYEHGDRRALIEQYPFCAEEITRLTREE